MMMRYMYVDIICCLQFSRSFDFSFVSCTNRSTPCDKRAPALSVSVGSLGPLSIFDLFCVSCENSTYAV